MGGIYEVDKTSGGTVTQTRTYYPAAGAMRIGSTLYYVLQDHLGSASVITNASGVTVSGGEQRYYPYGESRLTATMLTDKLFTGQHEMVGLGIYHYQARFYSPKIGRFLSADTIVPSYANPQNLNRFSYVLNNPLRYTDPTGHMLDDGDGGGCSPCTQLPKPKKEKDNEPDPSDGDADLDLVIGLNTNSCSLNSCYSWCGGYTDYYACGNQGRSRSPDYFSLNIGLSKPLLGLIVSGQVAITLDRFGNLWIGPGGALGPEAPAGWSVSFVGGKLAQDRSGLISGSKPVGGPPGEQRSENILGSWYSNKVVCIGICAGSTDSISAPQHGNEGGIGWPQASIGGGYSIYIGDFTPNSGIPIWSP